MSCPTIKLELPKLFRVIGTISPVTFIVNSNIPVSGVVDIPLTTLITAEDQ